MLGWPLRENIEGRDGLSSVFWRISGRAFLCLGLQFRPFNGSLLPPQVLILPC
jgi:hypothetical protein